MTICTVEVSYFEIDVASGIFVELAGISAVFAIMHSSLGQRYTYRVLQTIQMNLMLSWVWAEWAVLGRAKTALKFKFDI